MGFQNRSLCWGIQGGLQVCSRVTQDSGLSQKLQEGRGNLTEKPDIGAPFTEQLSPRHGCAEAKKKPVSPRKRKGRPLQHTQLEMSPEDHTRITHRASKDGSAGQGACRQA